MVDDQILVTALLDPREVSKFVRDRLRRESETLLVNAAHALAAARNDEIGFAGNNGTGDQR